MDKVQDVRQWLREVGRSPRVTLEKDERAQLMQVVNGPLFKPVLQALSDRMEGMKDRAMSLELAKPEELAMLQSLQAESRGIVVVLELIREIGHE